MKKRGIILWTYALAVLLGIALYLTSERVQRAEREYNDIQAQLKTETEAYHILKTEWTYLNRPDRLEDLAASHLKLVQPKPEVTVTSVKDFPDMPLENTNDAAPLAAVEPASGAPAATDVPAATTQAAEIAVTAPAIEAPVSGSSDLKQIANVPVAASSEPTNSIASAPPVPGIIPATFTSKKKTDIVQKQAPKHSNKSTAGTTFYQYMNRSASASAGTAYPTRRAP